MKPFKWKSPSSNSGFQSKWNHLFIVIGVSGIRAIGEFLDEDLRGRPGIQKGGETEPRGESREETKGVKVGPSNRPQLTSALFPKELLTAQDRAHIDWGMISQRPPVDGKIGHSV